MVATISADGRWVATAGINRARVWDARTGDRLTIDGTTGSVFAGDAPLLPPDPNNPYLRRIIEWVAIPTYALIPGAGGFTPHNTRVGFLIDG